MEIVNVSFFARIPYVAQSHVSQTIDNLIHMCLCTFLYLSKDPFMQIEWGDGWVLTFTLTHRRALGFAISHIRTPLRHYVNARLRNGYRSCAGSGERRRWQGGGDGIGGSLTDASDCSWSSHLGSEFTGQ